MSGRGRLLLNPGAGRGRGRRRAQALSGLAAQHDLELLESRDPSHLTELVRRAADDGLERVFVAGGDGTLNLAVQALAGTGTALAPIPLGSGNDLAMALGTPLGDMAGAIRFGLESAVGSIDLGRVETATAIRFFSCVSSCGFDAEVNAVANRITAVSGPIIYIWAVLRTLVSFRAPEITVDWAEGSWSGPAMFVVTANGPSYGGGMKIAPTASMVDGKLDVVIVKKVSKRTLLGVFPKVFSGRHVTHPAVTLALSHRVGLRANPPGDLYGDGERIGSLGQAAEITVAARALRIATNREKFVDQGS